MGTGNEEIPMELRPMEEADADKVAALTGMLGYARPVADIQQWIAGLAGRGETQRAWVACLDGEVVGWIEAYVELRLQTSPFTLIGGLVVKEGLRGRGIGRKLCKCVERWSCEQGIGKVRVTSRSTREAAHRFYQRDGYEVTKTSLVFEKLVFEKKMEG